MYGFSENHSSEEIIEKITKQNVLPDTANLSIIRLLKKDQRVTGALLETDALTFEYLIQRQRVNIGWDRCRIVEDVNVLRCFNCSEYGHKAASCKNSVCCPKCSGKHKAVECSADFEKCINCEHANNQKSDILLDTNHSAWNECCQILQRRIKNARKMIDYSA